VTSKRKQAPTTAPIGSVLETGGQEPWDYFDRLRELGDVVWDGELQTWVLASHAAYKQMGRVDDALWTKPTHRIEEQALDKATLLEIRGGRHGLVFLHGEEHTRAHRWRTRNFAPRTVNGWRTSVIRPIINMLFDRFIERGKVELVADVTDKMPIRVLAAIEGLPWNDETWIEHFRELQGIASSYRSEFGLEYDPVLSKRVLGAIEDMYEMLMPFVRERHERGGSDLISMLWKDGPELFADWCERDVVQTARALFDAGTDTTGKALANALFLLMSHPELHARILSEKGRTLANFADESLRLLSPRVHSFRMAEQDVDLGGVHIKKGESVTALIAAANRDPAAFACPHQVDLDRPRPRDHMSFHFGPRFCAGAPLARAEVEELVLAVLTRIPDLHLDTEAEQPRYDGVMSRQFRPLHAVFRPGGQG